MCVRPAGAKPFSGECCLSYRMAASSESVAVLQLFASSQLESKEFYEMEDLANHMGLFLQKTNIIRDYLEDINEEPAPRWSLEGSHKNSKTNPHT